MSEVIGGEFPNTAFPEEIKTLKEEIETLKEQIQYLLNNTMNSVPVVMESLPDITKTNAFVFTVTSNSTLNKTDMMAYTKGIYIPSKNDAVIIALSYHNNVYFRYRNNGAWNALKIL